MLDPRVDGPDGVDEGDALPLVQTHRPQTDLPVVAVRYLPPVGRVEGLPVLHLVGVGEPVDQPRRERILGQERPLVHEPAHLVTREAPRLRDALDHLLVEVPVERLGHLAMRRGHRGLGELVGGGLVVAGREHVGIGPHLVQGVAEEHLVLRAAHDFQGAPRHQVDLVRRRRQVVVLRPPVLEKRRDRLAGLPVVGDRVPDLLQLAPHEPRPDLRLQNHPADAIVHLRLAQAVGDRPHRRPSRAERRQQRVLAVLGEPAPHRKHEHRVGGHRRGPRHHEVEDGDAGHRDDDRQRQKDHDEPYPATDPHHRPP